MFLAFRFGSERILCSFIAWLPIQNTDFLLVVCYVVRCYISLIWPEASQPRDFVFHLTLLSFLCPRGPYSW